MNIATGTEFPPVALYSLLALAVAVLSLVATFRGEAVTSNDLFTAWGRLFDTATYLSIGAWSHVVVYWLLLFVCPMPSLWVKLNQLGHLLVLSLLGAAFYSIYCFWTEDRISPQRIMPRDGD